MSEHHPVPPARLPALRGPWGQIAAVVAIATMFAWLSRFWSPGPWNIVIWLAPLIAIAVFANKGAARLLLVPVFVVIFLAAGVGNEVLAHLVFGTCLYD